MGIVNERPEIRLFNYVFEHCAYQYIKHERAFSAFITICGFDYQEYELDEHSARVKLAERISSIQHIIQWFNNTQSK